MSTRARRPTDETATEIRDPGRPPIRAGGPASGLHAPLDEAILPTPPAGLGSVERSTPPAGLGSVERSTPTEIDPRRPIEQGTPTELTARPERSEPIRVISMKEQTAAHAAREAEGRVPLYVQLRSLAELSGRNDTPLRLGHLAPPRDPREVRARRVRANVLWGCLAVVLACAISLAVWLIAGR